MIRKYESKDLEAINSIGSLIDENFVKKNNIESRSSIDYVSILVYDDESIVKGFVEIESHFEILEIINIAVSSCFQNEGIASSLLEYVTNNFKYEKILLEVNETNYKAINLYKKFGFKEINKRKKYYGENDAIIMERSRLWKMFTY